MKHRKLEKKNKEESSLQQKKASLTVESAFILPLFFLVVVVITGMLDLYRISALIQTAMCEGAKELGMYAYCGPEDHNSPVSGWDMCCLWDQENQRVSASRAFIRYSGRSKWNYAFGLRIFQ